MLAVPRRAHDESIGYDAVHHEYVNMILSGIVDPTKVVRTALEDAASGAASMTTTEVMIVDLSERRRGTSQGCQEVIWTNR